MIIAAAAPVGLLTGLLAWFAAGGAAANAGQVGELQARLQAIHAPRSRPVVAADLAANLAAMPLFALTTGPNAVADPTIRLDGLSRSPRRVAALLSINGGPAGWMTPGEERDGVVLREVTPLKVVLDTPTGSKEIALGEQTSGQGAGDAPLSTAAAGSSAADPIPPGFRSPPPPASAPQARR